VETRAPGEALDLARRAVSEGHNRVVAVGGDGTVQEVLNGLLESAAESSATLPSLGVFAAGNGNDFARSLGLPKRPPAALAVALGASTAAVDVGRATARTEAGELTRYFAAAGGVGFDAQVAASMATGRRLWQRGRIAYALTVLNELRRFHNAEVAITFEAADGEDRLDRRILFAAIANGPYYGGGMRICPDARLDDGWLDLCIVGDISRAEAVWQLPGLYRGRHVTHPAVELMRARSVLVEGARATPAHLDGEPFHAVPLRFDVLPRAIRVAVTPGVGALQSPT
jgi:YegS/Rv2252/BmrU family lipid kinase